MTKKKRKEGEWSRGGREGWEWEEIKLVQLNNQRKTLEDKHKYLLLASERFPL